LDVLIKLKDSGYSIFRYESFSAEPHWENFYIAWTKGGFGRYFFNSLLYTIVVVLGIVFATSLAAYGISRLKIPGKNIIFYVFLAAMMIPIPGAFCSIIRAFK